jgi:hypothetical protein
MLPHICHHRQSPVDASRSLPEYFSGRITMPCGSAMATFIKECLNGWFVVP